MSVKQWVIYEFKTRRPVGHAVSYEQGFARCIELYQASGERLSYYVAEVSA